MWQLINKCSSAISGKTFALCFNFTCAPHLYGLKNEEWEGKWRTVNSLQYLTIHWRNAAPERSSHPADLNICPPGNMSAAHHVALTSLLILKQDQYQWDKAVTNPFKE